MMCSGSPTACSRDSRKKSPNPTRYIRTRIPTSPGFGVQPFDPAGAALEPFNAVSFDAVEDGFARRPFLVVAEDLKELVLLAAVLDLLLRLADRRPAFFLAAISKSSMHKS